MRTVAMGIYWVNQMVHRNAFPRCTHTATGYSGHSLLDDDAETAASIALSQYYHAAGLADDEIDHSLNPRDFTAYAGWLLCYVRVLCYSEILHGACWYALIPVLNSYCVLVFVQVAVFCTACAWANLTCQYPIAV
jgi:hypothetical protein